MTCPACGHPSLEGARFCSNCGQALVAPRGEERRVATVLFADLVGFTGLAETMDPEQVKHLVDGCFQRLVADVTAFGGRVDKIVGDAIIALFGAPVAHEDDAERAVRAALRMQNTLATRAQELGIGIRMRIGVNTGEVLVGALRAGGDYTAMGDVVNTASRLQELAPPGQVVVGPATHAATEQAIRYESLGQLEAKGREAPVAAWVALEAVAPPGRRPRRTKVPLVGRDTEVQLLVDGIRLAARHDRAFLAVVEGEGGMGKSRLLEAVTREAGLSLRALVFEGRCAPYGETNPWSPLVSSAAARLGIDPVQPPELVRELAMHAVARALRQPVDGPDVARTADGLLHLIGHPTPLDGIDPSRAREELVRSVLTLLEELARRHPVVLAVADLQWADPLFLDLLERLLLALGNLPFALITTARPEREERPWPPGAGRHTTLVLRLDPLDEEAADRMIRLLLGDIATEEVRRQLRERSGGNPFFLEELAELVRSTEAVPAAPALPGTLRGLVAARLDALGPVERAMLDNAAVLGSSGTWTGLARFAEALGQEADPATLAALADHDLLEVDGGRWSFRSELVREVAYATLTKWARAQRHVGVAAGYEEAYGDREDQAEQIAFHWAAAAELHQELGAVPGVPDDVADRAVLWLGRAAARNLRQEVLQTADRLATRALRLLAVADDSRRRHLLLLRAEARAVLRRLDAARLDASEALALAEVAGDDEDRARAHLVLGLADRTAGRLDDAEQHFATAVEVFRRTDDRTGEGEALRAWGLMATMAGAFVAAESHLADAERLAVEVGDRRALAWVRQHQAWIAFVQGDTTEADRRLHESAAVFADLGDRGGLAWAGGLLAFVRYQQGRRSEAEALSEHVRVEAGQRGDRWAEAMMLALLAAVRLWDGRIEEALDRARESHERFAAIEDRFGEVQALGPLARALVARGRVTEALQVADGLQHSAGTWGLESFVATVRAGVAVHAGRAEVGLDASSAAARDERGAFGLDARVLRGLALLQSARLDDALAELEAVAAQHPDSPHAAGAFALALVAAGRPEDAAALAAPAADASGATYLDRVVAGAALALAWARLGDAARARSAAETAVALAEQVGDVCATALATRARAEALALVHAEDADLAEAAAVRAADAVEEGADGWRVAVRLAAESVGA